MDHGFGHLGLEWESHPIWNKDEAFGGGRAGLHHSVLRTSEVRDTDGSGFPKNR